MQGAEPDPADVASIMRYRSDYGFAREVAISVLIPCYRVAPFIPDALASIERQRGLPTDVTIEVVLVVDGVSSDARSIRSLLEGCGTPYRFSTVVIELGRNVGAGLARCHGWAHCRGELVAFLDDDDLWHPDKLALQHALHERRPDQIASGHDYGHPASGNCMATKADCDVVPVTFSRMLRRSELATPTLMIRRRLWPRGPEPFRLGEDELMRLMIAREQPLLRLAAPLAWRSPAAPPAMDDQDGLTRQRLRNRAAQWRNYLLLVRRGRLAAWWLAVLLPWSVLLMVRRSVIDGVAKLRHSRTSAAADRICDATR